MPEFPRRILIQGGGYIAVEFAGIFAGLGAHVTLVYRGDNILRGFDDDVRQHLRMDMEKHGIKVVTGCKVAAIEKAGGHFSAASVDRQSVTADQVMFATGRTPNVAKLGLEEAGVELAKNGGIAVDEYSRTSGRNLRRRRRDQPHQSDAGRHSRGPRFCRTVFGGKPTKVDHTNVPTAVFSEPEVGTVGLTESEARARLARTDIYKAMFRPLKATLSGRDTTMLMKLVVDGLRPGGRLPRRRRRRRRDGPDGCHCGENGCHQSGLRRDHGAASDRLRKNSSPCVKRPRATRGKQRNKLT